MKLFLLPAITLFSFASCKTTNGHLSNASKYKTIDDILTVLNTNSNDKKAIKDLPIVYAQLQQEHFNKISIYKTAATITHWDAVLGEYKVLQTANDVIIQSPVAARLLTAVNYKTSIDSVRQLAAKDYYQQASLLLQSKKKEDARRAYTYFSISNYWVPGYKDVLTRLNEAYEKAVINVIINPIQDGNFIINNIDSNNLNGYFQQTLVNELNDSSYFPSKFFTAVEAKENNIQADWIIDLTFKNIKSTPGTYNYRYDVSSEIVSATDNGVIINGRRYDETARATINVNQQYLSVRLEMYMNIKDAITGKNIRLDTCNVSSIWNSTTANYIGNMLALRDRDWEFIRNSFKILPGKDEVLAELYNKIYPQVKNKISYAVE
jgi:hypothetical protein